MLLHVGGLQVTMDQEVDAVVLTNVEDGADMASRKRDPRAVGEPRGFAAWSGSDESSRIAMVSLETGEVTYLLPGGSNPRYSPTGHIVYAVGGTLRAVGFDADRLELTSNNPVPVLDNVETKASGAGNFGFSSDGALVYVTGTSGAAQGTLVWVDRERP